MRGEQAGTGPSGSRLQGDHAMKLRSILPLLACLLVFSACGDDDGDGGGTWKSLKK